MHSKGMVLISRMSKAARRRWIVRVVELCVEMAVLSVGCVAVALFVGKCLRFLGVG